MADAMLPFCRPAGTGPPAKQARTSRTSSVSLRSRTNIKQIRSKKDEALVKQSLHCKIIALADIDHTEGDFDDTDFYIGDTFLDIYPRLINRRRAVLADATGAMRCFFYVNPGYDVGDCIRITNYGIRLMRIVIHRNTVVEFNINIDVPEHIRSLGLNMLDSNFYPYVSLKNVANRHPFARISIESARIARITESQSDKVVTELYLDDASGNRMYVSCWRKAALLPFQLNQSVRIHDVIARESTYHHAMSININYKDEITLGALLPEVIVGEVEGCNEATNPDEVALIIVDGKDQYTTLVPRTILSEALDLEDMSLQSIRATLPINVRITMTLDDEVEGIVVLN